MKRSILILLFSVFVQQLIFAQSIETQAHFWYKMEEDTINSMIQWNSRQDSVLQLNTAAVLASSYHADTSNAKAINYNPSLRFHANTMKEIAVPMYLDRGNKHLLIVYQAEELQQENAVWTYSVNDTMQLGLTTKRLELLDKEYMYADSTGIQSKAVLNTISFNLRNYTPDSASAFVFGQNDSLDFKGNIAEIIFIEKSISRKDLQKWQSYLAIKYGITIKEQDYFDSDGNCIWELDSIYSIAVAGIGKDSIFQLEQKQSMATTTDDIISIGFGGIKESNVLNKTQVDHGQFLIWANNNATTQFYPTAHPVFEVMERAWKIKRSGNGTETKACCLKVDTRGLGITNPNALFLFIDRTADADFSMHTFMDVIQVDYIDNDGFAYFTNLYWDTDTSGFDAFSFAVNTKINNQRMAVNDPTATDASADAESVNDIYSQTADNISYYLYPNPSQSGIFTLEINSETATDYEIILFDVTGKELKTYMEYQKKFVSLSDKLLTKGQYILRIKSEKEVKSLKLIIN
jgi:hypothetical protein